VNPLVWDYLKKAFSARPFGMFVPPNWIALGLCGILGLINPGFWAIGLGLEFGYLWILSSNPRFQRYVAATRQTHSLQEWKAKIDVLLRQLNPDDQISYTKLEDRCRTLLEQQIQLQTASSGLQAQREGFGKLLWVFLRLLLTRQAIHRILKSAAGTTSSDTSSMEERIAKLQSRLNEPLTDDLRKSLTGQIEILQQRVEKRSEAKQKLAFLDAELIRIQEQVELIREQAVLSADPQTLSQRIDQITTTLGSTNQWIHDQQTIYGAVEDLLDEPPPLQISNEQAKISN
jgi:DNA repair exonuclease SbcCD ATPase subunit